MEEQTAFARDAATAAYYDRRAREYDDWWLGTGRFAGRDRPGWDAERERLVALVAGLPPARTLDVACGTAFLTRHLAGPVAALDQSPEMVAIARGRLPHSLVIAGDALALPFGSGVFERVFTGHFYGHLAGAERTRFLAEARRVAPELVVVDSALRPGVEPEGSQTRVLDDGSEHRVFKRYLTAEGLAEEIGGRPLLSGDWFVAAAA
jgi:ubiquinone/menaquinone biosynthesis C-methylase UbiE